MSAQWTVADVINKKQHLKERGWPSVTFNVFMEYPDWLTEKATTIINTINHKPCILIIEGPNDLNKTMLGTIVLLALQLRWGDGDLVYVDVPLSDGKMDGQYVFLSRADEAMKNTVQLLRNMISAGVNRNNILVIAVHEAGSLYSLLGDDFMSDYQAILYQTSLPKPEKMEIRRI